MIVVDVETTGINPKKNSIVSIGAINFDSPKNQFYTECKIFEGAEISEISLKVNGFLKSDIDSDNDTKKPLRESINEFSSWVHEQKTEKIIAGQNPAFDRDFLMHSFEKYQMNFPFTFRTIDLNSLCALYVLKNKIDVKIDKLNTNTIYEILGMPSEPNPHNALTGALMEAEAFSRLIYGKNMFNTFKDYPLPKSLVS
jgi:DNA polymerase III epsilon subunit-like protein